MNTPLNTSVTVTVTCVVLLLIAYVAGYFVCSSEYPDRVFPNRWIFEFYRPLIWTERILTKRDIEAGWGPVVPAGH